MMKKISAGLSAVAVAGTMMLSSATPASAGWWDWHRPHHSISVPGAVVAGAIGFGIGAAIANRLEDRWGDRWESHYRRCDARYKSYDWRTDTYVTRNGVRRLCRL